MSFFAIFRKISSLIAWLMAAMVIMTFYGWPY